MYSVIRPVGAAMQQNFEQIERSLGFSPDDNGKAGNFDAHIEQVIFSAPLSQKAIYHNLGRVPEGAIPIEQNAHGTFVVVQKDSKSITLESSAAMTATFLVI